MPEAAQIASYKPESSVSPTPTEISWRSSRQEILMYLRQKSLEQRARYPRTNANIESLLKKPRLDAIDLECIFNLNADEADVLINSKIVKRNGPGYYFDTNHVREVYEAVTPGYQRETPPPQPKPSKEIHVEASKQGTEKRTAKSPENNKKPANGKPIQSSPQNDFLQVNPQYHEKDALSFDAQKRRTGYDAGEKTSLDRYLKDISPNLLIPQEKEASLARRIRQGDRASFDELITSNLRFVITVAKEYRGRGLPLEDLIGEGNLGLVYAAKRFDESIGARFTTYAVWWIRQSILAALAEYGRMIRMPVNRLKHLSRIIKTVKRMEQETSRGFTIEEDVQDLSDETGLAESKIRKILCDSRDTLSLDAPVGDDEKTLGEIIADNQHPLPDAELEQKEFLEQVQDTLSTLGEREYEVIKLYYGLEEEDPLTLEEIGKQFGLTKERIRQIRDKAIEALKHPTRVRHLAAAL